MGYRDAVRHQQRTGRIARAMEASERKTRVTTSAKRGDRVRLLRTTDIFTNLEPGAEGTVSFIDDLGTLHVDWDSGSQLGLIPGTDRWERVGDDSD